MNKKSGLVLRIILGAYLIFLGCNLLTQLIKIQPSDMAVKSVFALIFIVTGALYAFHNARAVYRIVKEETADPEEKTEDKPLFEKPQHDKSMFRTAPMPSEEVLRKASAPEETDLRANMKYMEETPDEAGENTHTERVEAQPESTEFEKIEAKTQVISIERTAEKEVSEKAEKTEQTEQIEKTAETDSVHLAIEIMRSEEEDLEAAEEEIEKDYEEK